MQVLEGEEEVVTTFAGTIAGDSRHKGVFRSRDALHVACNSISLQKSGTDVECHVF
jgi:hypothetical protein